MKKKKFPSNAPRGHELGHQDTRYGNARKKELRTREKKNHKKRLVEVEAGIRRFRCPGVPLSGKFSAFDFVQKVV